MSVHRNVFKYFNLFYTLWKMKFTFYDLKTLKKNLISGPFQGFLDITKLLIKQF